MKIKGTYISAAFVALALGAWLASGDILIGGGGDADAGNAAQAQEKTETETAAPFRVRVIDVTASDRDAVLSARGRTEAVARVEVKAETGGIIAERAVAKGAQVAAGDLLCRIEAGARQPRLLQAKAQLAQAQFDHDAASRLAKGGFGAEQRVQATKAALDAARASVAEAELELSRIEIRAPFAGIVQDPVAETGDMLPVGQTCATIIRIDPMLVVTQISEQDVGKLRKGATAQVQTVTGARKEGVIRYIAPSSEPQTRTFRVEVEVANTDGALLDGVTARLEIPLTAESAHRLPSSALSIADDGQIGVKTVTGDNRVAFVPVTILGDDGEHIWVGGLPEQVTVILIGHDYVRDGSRVEPVRAAAGEQAS